MHSTDQDVASFFSAFYICCYIVLSDLHCFILLWAESWVLRYLWVGYDMRFIIFISWRFHTGRIYFKVFYIMKQAMMSILTYFPVVRAEMMTSSHCQWNFNSIFRLSLSQTMSFVAPLSSDCLIAPTFSTSTADIPFVTAARSSHARQPPATLPLIRHYRHEAQLLASRRILCVARFNGTAGQ